MPLPDDGYKLPDVVSFSDISNTTYLPNENLSGLPAGIVSKPLFNELADVPSTEKTTLPASNEKKKGAAKVAGISKEAFDEYKARIDEKISFNDKRYEERLAAMDARMERMLSEMKANITAGIAEHKAIAADIKRQTEVINTKLEGMGKEFTARLENVERRWAWTALLIGVVGVVVAVIVGGIQIMSAIKAIH